VTSLEISRAKVLARFPGSWEAARGKMDFKDSPNHLPGKGRMGYANAERKTGNIMNRREVQPKEETRANAERHEEPARLLGRRETFSSVTEQIGSIVLARRHPLP
jgi:hypothetical protein